MHPAARTLQVLFLVAGLALLVMGYVTQGDQRAQREVRLYWVCGPYNGSKVETKCESNGNGDNITFNNGKSDMGITVSLAGVGLLVASASVSIGASRRQPAAVPQAAYPQQPQAPVGY